MMLALSLTGYNLGFVVVVIRLRVMLKDMNMIQDNRRLFSPTISNENWL